MVASSSQLVQAVENASDALNTGLARVRRLTEAPPAGSSSICAHQYQLRNLVATEHCTVGQVSRLDHPVIRQ